VIQTSGVMMGGVVGRAVGQLSPSHQRLTCQKIIFLSVNVSQQIQNFGTKIPHFKRIFWQT